MADAATADDFSLSDTFGKVNHWRHILMDISMTGMVIGGLVATGGAMGALDPVIGWLKMHVSGLSGWLGFGEFASAAADSAKDGVFMSDNAGIDSHGGHGMHSGNHDVQNPFHAPESTNHATQHSNNAALEPTFTIDQFQDAQSRADRTGMTVSEILEGTHPSP